MFCTHFLVRANQLVPVLLKEVFGFIHNWTQPGIDFFFFFSVGENTKGQVTKIKNSLKIEVSSSTETILKDLFSEITSVNKLSSRKDSER